MARSKQQELVAQDAQTLADVVRISRQFQRSIRIDTDLGSEDSLSGYICQGTAKAVLENMGAQMRGTQQRAFTWTGPYGGGKSSLALLLCSLLGPNPGLRKKARALLGAEDASNRIPELEATGDGWLVIPVVGKRAKATEVIAEAVSKATGSPSKSSSASRKRDLVGELQSLAERHRHGVLLVIDELGKLLESAAQEGEDIYFFQELAEAANRSAGKFIVVGILHQSFDAYATRLGRDARDEWAKVQGRFVDIPLVSATDEVVELIGRAIEVDPWLTTATATPVAKVVASLIKQRRPSTPSGFADSLARCWPLHPVVAALLGPISRRRFSQNERSTFGFLASREPLGFVEFMQGSPVDKLSMYDPARYWDYLKANLEQSILASPDGHKWAIAAEAVDRAESKGRSLHVEITKCVALIELFRGGSGLVPEPDLLEVCIQGETRSAVGEALKDLVLWKILIERKHLGAFGVFAGSDFDIEAAIQQAAGELGTPDLGQLATLIDLQPIVAKRFYHQTGTMHWFTRRLAHLDLTEQEISTTSERKGSSGAFWLCIPGRGQTVASARSEAKKISDKSPEGRILLGVPENGERISDLALEYAACERVIKTRPELEGDTIARKELQARHSNVAAILEEELTEAFNKASWYWRGKKIEASETSTASVVASQVATDLFPSTPHLKNELINREQPSSNSNRARKDLMYRMARDGAKQFLGYDGYPADAGLYYSILGNTGLHRPRSDGEWSFGEPYLRGGAHAGDEAMWSLWAATKGLLLKESSKVRLSDLYQVWSSPPYGLRSGVMPVLSMAFFQAHRSALALYMDGVFTPDITEAMIDEWIRDPSCISLQFVSASQDRSAYLKAVTASIPPHSIRPTSNEPLEVARALVNLAVSLPHLTRRTTNVPKLTQDVRAVLLRASDPHRVLFSDLPSVLQATDPAETYQKLSEVFHNLIAVYPQVLHNVQSTLLKALDQSDGDLGSLRSRARVVKGIAGEFNLEAFITRLEAFDNSEQAVEGMISLACGKPQTMWVDRDIDAALLQLTSWAYDFRRAETVAPLRGRPSTRRALGVVFGGGRGKEGNTTVDIDDREAKDVEALAGRLLAELGTYRREIALAALAEAGTLLINSMREEASNG